MEVFSSIVLALFTLLGYSAGAALSAPDKRTAPGLFDLACILALCVGAFITRPGLGKGLAILVWLALGVLAGLLLTRLQTRKKYVVDPFTPPPAGTSAWRRAWLRWLHFSARFGDYQSRALLALLYFTVVLPFGLALRLFGDPLNTRKPSSQSMWQDWTLSSKTIDEARRQF